MLQLDSILKMLKRWLWLLILGAIAGIGVTLLVLVYLGLFPSYQAVVTLAVGTKFEGVSLSPDELQMSEGLIPSYVVLAERPPLTQAVVDNLNLSISADDLATYRLEVTQIGQTSVMQILAKDPNPVMAAAIANELARQLVKSAPVRPHEFIQIIGPAKVPESQSLEPYLIMMIGGVVGLLLAGTVAVVIELKQDRPQTLSWAASRLDMPLLGAFNASQILPRGRKFMARSPSKGDLRPLDPVWWVVIQTFKRALSEAGEREVQGQGRMLVLTSPDPSPSKSVAALELARAWTTTGSKVILVDADPYQPMAHLWFNVPNEAGVTTFLTQSGQAEEQLDKMLVRADTENLMLLTSGPMPSERSALLLQPPWDRLMSMLRQKADMIVLNSPALRSGPEAMILGAHAEGVLLVIDLGKTSAPAANQATDLLIRGGCTVLGAVVNQR